MNSQQNYLYGVTWADTQGVLEGVAGLDGGQVRLVRHGPVAVVVSQADTICFSQLAPEKTLRYLADHQRVLERVLDDSAVLPVKFGTYAADDHAACGILDSGREDFVQALNRYGGKLEMDLVAWWPDLGGVLGELAADPTVVAMKSQVALAPQADPAAATQQKVRLGQLVKGLLDRRRSEIADELTSVLSARWGPLVSNSTKDDSMILNAAALVDRGQEGRFDDAVEALNRRYQERLSFRRVGPLPPYSFATVEVTLLTGGELDAARQTLELAESANLDECKAACRRLLREHHPDRNAAQGSADRVARVTAAYDVLERYARNFRHRFGAPGGASTPVVKVSSATQLRARTIQAASHAA